MTVWTFGNAKATSARSAGRPQRYMVEGEALTVPQIAQRLNLRPETARYRMLREQRKPGRVTWEGLGR